ncbi:MAG TPA: efflux RND transporter periplasmic adaptor subunit [Cellvibrio sp.]|nr:efflux RND transporter periplasmic adaptor subunit [Cellvibrio sp.]
MMKPVFANTGLSLIGLTVLALLTGCGEQQVAAQGGEFIRQVEVVVAEPKALMVTDSLPGRVTPIREAQVRARVAGIVMKRHFEEGSDVKEGQLLFELDAAPYKVALAKATAELARAEAIYTEAQTKAGRFEDLAKAKAISVQELDSARATLGSTRAGVLAAKADVESAKLDLGYTRITAPISGRIGKALVTEGMLVGQSEVTEVARIHQLNPVYVDFSHSLSNELARQQDSLNGNLADGDVLEARIEGMATTLTGTLKFADAAVDQTTGTIALRGEFPNPDGRLLPGMYVQVLTRLQNQSSAFLVPQRAVSRGADGKPQVLVVGEQGVEVRAIQTGKMIGSEWQILSGLNAGDKVIVGSNAMLQPGDKVEPVIKPTHSTGV